MMDCEKVRELLPLLADNDLDEADAAKVQAHLEICADCRKAFEDAGSIAGLLAESLSSIEMRDDFEAKVGAAIASAPALPGKSARFPGRVLRVAAAIAASVLLVATALLFFWPRPPAATLVSGSVTDSTGQQKSLEQDRRHKALGDCVVRLADNAIAFIADGSWFTVSKKALVIDEGFCYAASPSGSVEPSIVKTRGLRAELHNAQVFLSAGNGSAPIALLPIFSPAFAQEGGVGEAALIIVFLGRAEVEIDGTSHTVGMGQFLFADEAALGPQALSVFKDNAAEEIDRLDKVLQPLAQKRDLYNAVVECYDRRTVWLQKQKEIAVGRAELDELDARIRIVTDAKDAHQRTLVEVLTGMKGPAARLDDWKARLDALQNAEKGFLEVSKCLLHPGKQLTNSRKGEAR